MAKKTQKVETKVVTNLNNEVVREVVKESPHKGVYTVKFTGGNLIQTNMTHDEAIQKVKDLEAHDKIMKGKNWSKGFYEII